LAAPEEKARQFIGDQLSGVCRITAPGRWPADQARALNPSEAPKSTARAYTVLIPEGVQRIARFRRLEK